MKFDVDVYKWHGMKAGAFLLVTGAARVALKLGWQRYFLAIGT